MKFIFSARALSTTIALRWLRLALHVYPRWHFTTGKPTGPETSILNACMFGKCVLFSLASGWSLNSEGDFDPAQTWVRDAIRLQKSVRLPLMPSTSAASWGRRSRASRLADRTMGDGEPVTVTLAGGGPWGFRLQGGGNQSLQVAKVTKIYFGTKIKTETMCRPIWNFVCGRIYNFNVCSISTRK